MVTLGMVAAISGAGGLLAANPPSWATNTQPARATAAEHTAQQETARPLAEHAARRADEQGSVRPASQKGTGHKETERGAAARAKTARKEARRAARQQKQPVYSAQPQASPSAPASAVSRGS